ncbi:uncharacterized protein LOC109135594 isoform X2 [Beta vulgaris subsp. vulgaris]|uniref:uncharacterized protein LOC109135594 isoform X2 n=1 Tax=Beta vulgaris subsp. vulgaris TaxID=3555 RepID=UPI00090162B8|nr:uncharacterized protein LOC109135594 isoform X2 [Beta vulgaris subsp. vulgaris]XP_057252305.1 uncharacterized protein LOC109135594 isoform X2 [Beta vulgaris subsp. vulgaris]
MRKLKAQEFINLRMGSMTIFEYYGKFIALSRFAPEVVATEELRSERFEQGLTEEIQLGLGGETFTSLYVVYGRASHIYGLQSRRDKKNGVIGEKRKDFNTGGNQGNFKRNRNGNGNFQGRTTRITAIRVDLRECLTASYVTKIILGKTVRENQCFVTTARRRVIGSMSAILKHGKDQKGQGHSNQVRSGFNQSENQGSKLGGQQNNQGNYSKPASENPNQNKPAGKMYVMSRKEAEKSVDVVSGGEYSVGDF